MGGLNMYQYMNKYNGHNKELVVKINTACNDEHMIKNVIVALRAICELCEDECSERLGFVPFHEKDIREYLGDILMNICDDTDLEIILLMCRYENK